MFLNNKLFCDAILDFWHDPHNFLPVINIITSCKTSPPREVQKVWLLLNVSEAIGSYSVTAAVC